jgi:hypothetical protein
MATRRLGAEILALAIALGGCGRSAAGTNGAGSREAADQPERLVSGFVERRG